ncbi:MAG: hypothetical protein ABF969_04015 [Sporolactobacillus sp.]
MNQDKLKQIAEAVSGLKEFEWSQIKGHIDWLFHEKVIKLQLDDPVKIEKHLRENVISQRLGSDQGTHDN